EKISNARSPRGLCSTTYGTMLRVSQCFLHRSLGCGFRRFPSTLLFRGCGSIAGGYLCQAVHRLACDKRPRDGCAAVWTAEQLPQLVRLLTRRPCQPIDLGVHFLVFGLDLLLFSQTGKRQRPPHSIRRYRQKLLIEFVPRPPCVR